jgi:hypothetical protein
MTVSESLQIATYPLKFRSVKAFESSLEVWLQTPEHYSGPILRSEILFDAVQYDDTRSIKRRVIPRVHRSENTFVQNICAARVKTEHGVDVHVTHTLDPTSLPLRHRRMESDASIELQDADLPYFYPRVASFCITYREHADSSEILISAIPLPASQSIDERTVILTSKNNAYQKRRRRWSTLHISLQSSLEEITRRLREIT